jgi:hypothetical protein
VAIIKSVSVTRCGSDPKAPGPPHRREIGFTDVNARGGGTLNASGIDANKGGQSPLTAAGMASFAGLLIAYDITITGTLPNGNTTGTVTYFVIDTSTKTIVGQVVLPDAVKQNNSVSLTLKVPKASASYAIGSFDNDGFQASSFLRVQNPTSDRLSAPSGRPSGTVGLAG